MIFSDFALALGQLSDPRFRGVLSKGLGLTLLLLLAVYAVTFWGIGWLVPDTISLPVVGEVGWVDDLTSWGSLILMMGLSVFLMVPVASAFTSMFLDEVADAVEERHYAHLPPAENVSIAEGLRDTFNFMGLLVAANIAAVFVYLIMIVTVVLAPFTPLVFWGLNGFLLGREYFQITAMRRIGRTEAKKAFRRHLPQIWLAGALMAVPLTIPFINLLIPVLGAATFTHLYHRVEN